MRVINFMLSNAIFALLIIVFGSVAAGAQSSFSDQLRKLHPSEHIDQICSFQLQNNINRDEGDRHVDKIISDTFSSPDQNANSMDARGAAVRIHGSWLRLEFRCAVASDGISVTEIDYKLGPEIEKKYWRNLYLYD